MAHRTLVVFTYESTRTMLAERGSQAWALDAGNARRCTYIVCTRNRRYADARSDEHAAAREEHGAAFMVGRIAAVEPAPDLPRRYAVRFDAYAILDPQPVVWPGHQNPVWYVEDIENLGVEPDKLNWIAAPDDPEAEDPALTSCRKADEMKASDERGAALPTAATSGADQRTIKAGEVLVLDSSTFIKEIGLTSTRGSALKHYLYCRGTQLVVPQAAAEEYERNLVRKARERIERIQKDLRWLTQFCDGIAGWPAPGDDIIEDRAKALAAGDGLGALFFPETGDARFRARQRNSSERPPAHWRAGLGDCRIWEQCLELLSDHDVVFVAADPDFRSRGEGKSLHPQLRAEAERAGAGRNLTFHPDMESLLQELKSEIPAIPNEAIFEFVYDPNMETIQELQSNSECRPTASGAIKQTRLATEACDVIEVRLEVEDKWENSDGSTTERFELSGSCRYHLGSAILTDLTTDVEQLLMTKPDGSVHAVKGSFVNLRVSFRAGTPPLRPKRGTLE